MDTFGLRNFKNRNEIYENSDNQFVTSLRNIRFDQMDDQWNDSDLDLNRIREEFLNNGIDVMDFESETSEMNVFPRPIVKRNPLVSLQNNTIQPIITRKQPKKPPQSHCVFCQNNHEPEYVYTTHPTKDSFGRVICPKLRSYKCPTCGAKGDKAHTLKYCPNKPIYTMQNASLARAPIRH